MASIVVTLVRRSVLAVLSVGVSFFVWAVLVGWTENFISFATGNPVLDANDEWTTLGGLALLVLTPVTAFILFSRGEKLFLNRAG